MLLFPALVELVLWERKAVIRVCMKDSRAFDCSEVNDVVVLSVVLLAPIWDRAWVTASCGLTVLPVGAPPGMLLANACRKSDSVALLLEEPPRAVTRFWKLCCNELTVESVEPGVDVLELDADSFCIKLCRSA